MYTPIMMNNVQCFVFYSDLPDYQTDLVTGGPSYKRKPHCKNKYIILEMLLRITH